MQADFYNFLNTDFHLRSRGLQNNDLHSDITTPTADAPSGSVGMATSGIAMLAGGAAAMLLLILAIAVLHMWRRQCRLEDDLKSSHRQLDQHERTAASGLARRVTQKYTDSFWRSGSVDNVNDPTRGATNPGKNVGVSGRPALSYPPGTQATHGALVTSSSLNQAIDRAHIEDTINAFGATSCSVPVLFAHSGV